MKAYCISDNTDTLMGMRLAGFEGIVLHERQEILDKIISGELKEYRVSPKDAFQFQLALRSYGKRQSITGIAQRGGDIIYTLSDNEN